MNKFDQIFFKKYTNEHTILGIFHRHTISILDNIIFWLFLFVAVPVFFYYHNSFDIQSYISFLHFEIYLVCIWCIIMYQIFDWYNDVFILTETGVIDLEWSPIKSSFRFIEYENIEGIEVIQRSFWDTILGSGNLVLHTVSGDYSMIGAHKPKKVMEAITQQMDEHSARKTQWELGEFDIFMEAMKDVIREKADIKRKNEDEYASEDEVKKLKRDSNTIDLR